jgi:hypothetical protein
MASQHEIPLTRLSRLILWPMAKQEHLWLPQGCSQACTPTAACLVVADRDVVLSHAPRGRMVQREAIAAGEQAGLCPPAEGVDTAATQEGGAL